MLGIFTKVLNVKSIKIELLHRCDKENNNYFSISCSNPK